MGRRLAVIQTPSLNETAWAEALTKQATALGLGVLDVRDGSIPENVDTERDWIVFATTPDVADAAIQPTDWLVIHDSPAMARWLLATATEEAIGSRTVATLSSHRLAIAQTVATLPSATVIEAADLTANVPVLGAVSRASAQWAGAAPDTQEGALGVLGTGATADWPMSLFYFPKGDNLEGGTADFDLTGRARLLMFGPYIYLPPGLWAIDVHFEIDPQQREVPLRMEWGAGDDYVEVLDSVREAGVYTITLERQWPAVEAAQFRLWLTQARFQGHLRVVDCRVRRLHDPSPITAIVQVPETGGPASDRKIISA